MLPLKSGFAGFPQWFSGKMRIPAPTTCGITPKRTHNIWLILPLTGENLGFLMPD
jgi:hypothetical protein